MTTGEWLDRYDEAVEAAKKEYYTGLKEVILKEGQSGIMKLFTEPFREPCIIPVTETSDTGMSVFAVLIGKNNKREGECALKNGQKKTGHGRVRAEL